jgi:hypothetical protein
MAIELNANEIARRLAANAGVIGPKFTLTLDPPEFEQNEKYVAWVMQYTDLVQKMLEMFFASQGLKSVTMKWEGLDKMRKPSS